MPYSYFDDKAADRHCSAADYAGEYLFNALNIGEEMLVSGAEVSRVEESIRRICMAYGAERVDVFAISTAIFATIYSPLYGALSQTRRLTSSRYDLHKLTRLNSLACRICDEMPLFEEVERELEDIRQNTPRYSEAAMFGIYALVSSSFTLFFGGTWMDTAASAVIGAFLRCMDYVSRRLELPSTIAAVLWSFAGGCLAQLFVASGFGHSTELISVGNVMLLIPGMLLTNSIRDMFSGDTISALHGFCNAFLLAALIALGFALPSFLW